jgi:hypothetical protein
MMHHCHLPAGSTSKVIQLSACLHHTRPHLAARMQVKYLMNRHQGLMTLFVYYAEGPKQGKNMATQDGADGEALVLTLQKRTRQEEDGSTTEAEILVAELYKHGYRGCLQYVTAPKDGRELAAYINRVKAEQGQQAEAQPPLRRSRLSQPASQAASGERAGSGTAPAFHLCSDQHC